MPAAYDRNLFHFHVRIGIAPECLLDANSVVELRLCRLRSGGNLVQVCEELTRFARGQYVPAPQKTEELYLSSIEWVQGILRAVHDHDGRRSFACRFAFEVAGRGHIRCHRCNSTKTGGRFERKAKRHVAAA